jgi:hypothetical protein
MKAWDNLPNAKLIDWVLADLKRRPGTWDEAWAAAWDEARGAARAAAWAAARAAAWAGAWAGACAAAWDAARDAARGAAWDVLVALVAYDEAADLLDMPSDAVRLLAVGGMPAAVLMEPYLYLLRDAADALHRQKSDQQSSAGCDRQEVLHQLPDDAASGERQSTAQVPVGVRPLP